MPPHSEPQTCPDGFMGFDNAAQDGGRSWQRFCIADGCGAFRLVLESHGASLYCARSDSRISILQRVHTSIIIVTSYFLYIDKKIIKRIKKNK